MQTVAYCRVPCCASRSTICLSTSESPVCLSFCFYDNHIMMDMFSFLISRNTDGRGKAFFLLRCDNYKSLFKVRQECVWVGSTDLWTKLTADGSVLFLPSLWSNSASKLRQDCRQVMAGMALPWFFYLISSIHIHSKRGGMRWELKSSSVSS